MEDDDFATYLNDVLGDYEYLIDEIHKNLDAKDDIHHGQFKAVSFTTKTNRLSRRIFEIKETAVRPTAFSILKKTVCSKKGVVKKGKGYAAEGLTRVALSEVLANLEDDNELNHHSEDGGGDDLQDYEEDDEEEEGEEEYGEEDRNFIVDSGEESALDDSEYESDFDEGNESEGDESEGDETSHEDEINKNEIKKNEIKKNEIEKNEKDKVHKAFSASKLKTRKLELPKTEDSTVEWIVRNIENASMRPTIIEASVWLLWGVSRGMDLMLKTRGNTSYKKQAALVLCKTFNKFIEEEEALMNEEMKEEMKEEIKENDYEEEEGVKYEYANWLDVISDSNRKRLFEFLTTDPQSLSNWKQSVKHSIQLAVREAMEIDDLGNSQKVDFWSRLESKYKEMNNLELVRHLVNAMSRDSISDDDYSQAVKILVEHVRSFADIVITEMVAASDTEKDFEGDDDMTDSDEEEEYDGKTIWNNKDDEYIPQDESDVYIPRKQRLPRNVKNRLQLKEDNGIYYHVIMDDSSSDSDSEGSVSSSDSDSNSEGSGSSSD